MGLTGLMIWFKIGAFGFLARWWIDIALVMVIHSDERDWIEGDGRQIGLKRVLVAFDFSDHSEQALKLGLLISQEYQAELHLLHVLPPFTLNEPEISWYPLGSEGVYHKAARRLQKAVPDEAHLWCKIKNVVSEGQPYREIIHYAERNEIDLVCIGAQGAGFGLLTLFGSNVDRVLRQAPCPVLVARPLKHARRLPSGLIEREASAAAMTMPENVARASLRNIHAQDARAAPD